MRLPFGIRVSKLPSTLPIEFNEDITEVRLHVGTLMDLTPFLH